MDTPTNCVPSYVNRIIFGQFNIVTICTDGYYAHKCFIKLFNCSFTIIGVAHLIDSNIWKKEGIVVLFRTSCICSCQCSQDNVSTNTFSNISAVICHD
jgi:hypothetical protein